MQTTNPLAELWDSAYQTCAKQNTLADWEKLPAEDLKNFLLNDARLNHQFVHTVLDIGCGRGAPLLSLIGGNSPLNDASRRVVGIDISSSAIEQANRQYRCLSEGTVPNLPLQDDLTDVRCSTKVEFRCADILEVPPDLGQSRFDLVIDWMCFHEIRQEARDAYVAAVTQMARQWFVLNVFCKSGHGVSAAAQEDLPPALGQIHKFPFSEQDILKMFGDHFDVIRTKTFKPDPNPDPPHDDGAIAAKIAFLMLRHQD